MTRRTLLFSGSVAWAGELSTKSLVGWEQEGAARWSVEGDTLVGRQGPHGEEGDLFSRGSYQNFVLECEWRMRYPGNSGIWFRVAGPKTGYQVDFLDQPSHPGVLAGSLYCMGKAFVAENRNPVSVHRDDWNRLRLTVAGDRMVVEQNGIVVVDVVDRTFPGAGRIGVQIHRGQAFDGMEVRLRQLRIRER